MSTKTRCRRAVTCTGDHDTYAVFSRFGLPICVTRWNVFLLGARLVEAVRQRGCDMANHPVKRTLERDVLPYLVSARLLRRQWFYVLHSIFGYTTDLVVALTAIGITSPLLATLGAPSGAQNDVAHTPRLSTILGSVPDLLYYPAAALVIIWIVLRVTFNREDGQKRAVLAKSCTQVLRQAEASLPTSLSKSDPMPALTELLEKSIRPTVDRNIQENSWPWTPFAPEIEAEVKNDLNRLCGLYESDWAPVDPLGLRPPASGGTV